jgi:hypothetical protein
MKQGSSSELFAWDYTSFVRIIKFERIVSYPIINLSIDSWAMVAVFPDNSMTLYMTIMSSLDTVPAKFLYLHFGLLFCGCISGS